MGKKILCKEPVLQLLILRWRYNRFIRKFFIHYFRKREQILKPTATGYKPFEEKINITSTPIVLNIQLKEKITELKAVVMITLSAKRFVYLGYFISLGIDRTQNEINNHCKGKL